MLMEARLRLLGAVRSGHSLVLRHHFTPIALPVPGGRGKGGGKRGSNHGTAMLRRGGQCQELPSAGAFTACLLGFCLFAASLWLLWPMR